MIKYCTGAKKRKDRLQAEKGVALTGRHRTGPPCSVTDPDRRRRRQTAKQCWPIRRASNNLNLDTGFLCVCVKLYSETNVTLQCTVKTTLSLTVSRCKYKLRNSTEVAAVVAYGWLGLASFTKSNSECTVNPLCSHVLYFVNFASLTKPQN